MSSNKDQLHKTQNLISTKSLIWCPKLKVTFFHFPYTSLRKQSTICALFQHAATRILLNGEIIILPPPPPPGNDSNEKYIGIKTLTYTIFIVSLKANEVHVQR